EILSKAPKSAFGTMTLAEKDKKVSKLKAEIAERETELKGVLRQMLERMLFEEENVNIAIVERLEVLLEVLIRGERRQDEDFAVLKKRLDAIARFVREKADEDPCRELLNDVDTKEETREERRERLLTIKKKAGG
ncbi:MAG: hypothetical protein GTN76_15155, partial [Candidatus Aenigmarchaeota archaeon]|nr:hypothetical protein [Candidatus Aenigmarchaeota archaeon]